VTLTRGYADAARFGGGGSNITTIRLLPHRGHRSRLSSPDNGNARPRVQTSVSKSNSRRKVHSRLDRDAGLSSRPWTHRATMRQPSESASPMVSTPIEQIVYILRAPVKGTGACDHDKQAKAHSQSAAGEF
jgi:hypothetical protein